VPVIGGVAVVVPARDEEASIGACLDGVRTALAELPPTITRSVTVVLDRCVDGTPALVAVRPDVVALHVGSSGVARSGDGPARIPTGDGVGAIRDAGVRDALERLRLPSRSVWLLHTDADTVVPPDWAVAHLAHAEAGAAAVAGTVELSAGLSTRAAVRYGQLVRSRTVGGEHRHAYGANLGVRADAYEAVGGFPADGAGEDSGLWTALRRAGYPLRYADLRVRTSARTAGRAAGGLADLLRGFDETAG
jgi:hypothetical protein